MARGAIGLWRADCAAVSLDLVLASALPAASELPVAEVEGDAFALEILARRLADARAGRLRTAADLEKAVQQLRLELDAALEKRAVQAVARRVRRLVTGTVISWLDVTASAGRVVRGGLFEEEEEEKFSNVGVFRALRADFFEERNQAPCGHSTRTALRSRGATARCRATRCGHRR